MSNRNIQKLNIKIHILTERGVYFTFINDRSRKVHYRLPVFEKSVSCYISSDLP